MCTSSRITETLDGQMRCFTVVSLHIWSLSFETVWGGLMRKANPCQLVLYGRFHIRLTILFRMVSAFGWHSARFRWESPYGCCETDWTSVLSRQMFLIFVFKSVRMRSRIWTLHFGLVVCAYFYLSPGDANRGSNTMCCWAVIISGESLLKNDH